MSAAQRTTLFARYSLVGLLLGAVGALCAGLPQAVARHPSIGLSGALDGMFLLYALLGATALLLYRRLTPAIEPHRASASAPLGPSKPIVYRLAALFSVDYFGSGFIVQSVLALWLFQRFDLPLATAGTIFFWSGVLAACSQLAAPLLAKRIGLINTMVFTHLPANVAMALVPFMPNLPLAIALLMVRSALSKMDVPATSSYVMAIVSPAERPAAASLTAAPRSLASAVSPLLAGYLLSLSPFGWPLVIGGAIKAAYDLLLLAMFRAVRPPEEATTR